MESGEGDGVRRRGGSRVVFVFVSFPAAHGTEKCVNSQGRADASAERLGTRAKMNPRVAAIEARVATCDARGVAQGGASFAIRRHTYRC